jgi:isocitrate dehydrogenase
MATDTPITVAHGDGIGPEIMEATLRILREAGARLDVDAVEIGESVYKRGISAGIEPAAWDSLRRTGVFLKAPITTPQGGGVKSLNVTVRKTLGLFANVRPVRSYAPYIETHHPFMDLVIVRENEEDLYAGIEHRQTRQVAQCLKLITRPGCERILRYAFEYTRTRERKKLTCLTKDNIMKVTDGLFHKVFNELAEQYEEVETEHMIVDIGMARVANTPEEFDVVVLPNLYGDILSDIAAEVSGSVGLCGSANIGDHGAMFEAVHGSAPDIAGKDIANPSGLLLSAVKMLAHIGQAEVAETIHNAWLRTIEDGIHTHDMKSRLHNATHVGTKAFADAVVGRLGQEPQELKAVHYHLDKPPVHTHTHGPEKKELTGVDVFLDWSGGTPEDLGAHLQAISTDALAIVMVTNRGVKVWPEGLPETFCTDHWRCRFMPKTDGAAVTHQDVIALLQRAADRGLDFIKTEHLCTFDGQPGYSLGQGQ